MILIEGALVWESTGGSHTYDVIAKANNDIHSEFKITKKVSVTNTDNGSNFLKAFRIFGPTTNEEEE
jgi:hypothetical protein